MNAGAWFLNSRRGGMLVLLASLAAGCGKSKEDVEFERRDFFFPIKRANNDLIDAKKKVMVAVRGDTKDLTAARTEVGKTIDEFKKALKTAQDVAARPSVPESADAQELAKAFKSYLNTEETVVLPKVDKIRANFDKKEFGVLEKLNNEVLFKESGEAEKKDYEAFVKAFNQFATNHEKLGFK